MRTDLRSIPGKDTDMALARMTAESRAMLTRLARSPADLPEAGLISDLVGLGFVERLDGRWQLTRAGKHYVKALR